jgi:glycerophosphoryl diester phosphodiesterase
MRLLIVLSAVVIVGICLPSGAPYIKADGRPLNIAHRGLASLLPENTLESFSSAMYQGADFI